MVSLQPYIAVGIVDDEAFVRSALRVYLSNAEDIEVIGEAAGGTEAISMVENSNPDVLLLDLQMPDLDGVEVTRRLREKGFTTRIVVVTAHVDDQYVTPALLAGASGYIVKDSEPQKIVQSVRDVTRGELVIDPQVIRYLIDAASRSNPAKHGRLRGHRARKTGTAGTLRRQQQQRNGKPFVSLGVHDQILSVQSHEEVRQSRSCATDRIGISRRVGRVRIWDLTWR